jgi:hypothetical protein
VLTRAVQPALTVWRRLSNHTRVVLLFATACCYHGAQSAAHTTPYNFDDEFLYVRLSQSIASGNGLSIWGHTFFFPAPLVPLLHAPLWLLSSKHAFLAALLLNAVAMSSVVFPVYWLAGRFVSAGWSWAAAAFAVAIPEMAYHNLIMTEAVAYPLFMLAIAAIVRAVADEGMWTPWIAVSASWLAIAARVQMVVLVCVYFGAVAVCAPSKRRHVWPLATLIAPLAIAIGVAGTRGLGPYRGAASFDLSPAGVAHWAVSSASLLPISAGFLIVPAAALGVGYALLRPHDRAESVFAVTAVIASLLFLLEAGVIAQGEARSAQERYLFYLLPLVFVSFLLYIKRGAPRRALYATAAIAFGVACALSGWIEAAPKGGLFRLNSGGATVVSWFEYYLGPAWTEHLFVFGAALLGVAAAALPLHRRDGAVLCAEAAILLSAFGGFGAYQLDHLSARSFEQSAPGDLSWIDDLHVGSVTYVATSQSDRRLDDLMKTWNRSVVDVALLNFTYSSKGSGIPYSQATIGPRGMLHLTGELHRGDAIVVHDPQGRYTIEGARMHSPVRGFALYWANPTVGLPARASLTSFRPHG